MAQPTSYMGWKLDYTQPPGEPALVGPDSVTWRIYKNPVTMAIGGICAVLLEFADPRIRSGVWDHSTYRFDPVGRSTRTGTAAAIGAYGPASAARHVIAGVTRMHAKVAGNTPDGTPYRALDPELLDWVGATAGYGFLTAYDRFAARLSEADKERFFREGPGVGALYGVQASPKSVEDFHRMMMRLEPRFEPHEINFEFLRIVESAAEGRNMPARLRHYIACAAVDILPPIVRERLELGKTYRLGRTGRLAVNAMAALADRVPDLRGPAAQSCERLGLPRNFLWLRRGRQRKLLRKLASAGAPAPAADCPTDAGLAVKTPAD